MALLKRIKSAITEDRLDVVAAGVSFYLFLAMFPLLFAAVSLYGLVADPQTAEQHLGRLELMMPASAVDVVRIQVREIVSDVSTGWGALIAILIALYSAGKGAKALIKGLNIAYDEQEGRGFLKKNLVAFAFTLGFLVFLAISLALVAVVPGMFDDLGILQDAIRWTLLLALILAALALVYRYGPATAEPRWTIVGAGSLTAALLWLAASAGFAWFAKNFGNFNETYGMIAGAAVLLLWLQISSFVILLGAEINHVLETHRADPSPKGILDFEI